MKFNKKFLAVAVAGALTAATAVPALALENQFSGAFVTYYDLSNFNAAGSIQPNAPTANYFEQRVRLGYTAKADDNLKLITKFEFDYSNWGNNSYDSTVGRGNGGAIGADTVNMETKNLYLDWSIPSAKLNVKIGMQPFDDSFKGIFASADMAGILLTHDYANASTSAGFFRWNDSGSTLGKNTRDMFVLDGKFNITKDTKIGAAYYFVNSDNLALINVTSPEDLTVHMLGVNAATKIGPLTVDGFLAYQFGEDNITNLDRSAIAANVGANMNLAAGTARAEILYASGDNNNSSEHSFYTPYSQKFAQYKLAESGFYNNEMVILGRDKNAMTNDNAIVYDANNNNRGVIFGSVGYDFPFTSKLSGSANAGFAAVAEDNTGIHDSNYLGTEVNCELGYKFTDNLNLSARAAYVVLGDYYTAGEDNPYDLKLLVKYIF